MATTRGKRGGLRPVPLAQRLFPTDMKESLCVEVLTKGYIDTFVEFFVLSHRPPVLVNAVRRCCCPCCGLDCPPLGLSPHV